MQLAARQGRHGQLLTSIVCVCVTIPLSRAQRVMLVMATATARCALKIHGLPDPVYT